ncbi:MAG: MinD/ParA family protein [Clostridiales bacterium]|nr:MinD/ParA family protein [Clostridiales bacterium]
MKGVNFSGPRVIKGSNYDSSQPGTTTPRIITVTSGKGGVGKTSLSVNLGISLAKAGNEVVIFDADLGLANVEVISGLAPPLNLYDCLQGRADIKDIITPGPAGVKIISGGSGFSELANLSSSSLQNLTDSLGILDDEADFIIIDTAAGISKNVLAFVASVKELILVLTPEPTSITDAYSIAKVISKYSLHSEINVIINRAAGQKDAGQTLMKFERACLNFLGLSVNYLGYVPEDKTVFEAIKAQVPLLIYKANSPAAKCIPKIGDNLSNKCNEDLSVNTGIREFTGKLARLFRR